MQKNKVLFFLRILFSATLLYILLYKTDFRLILLNISHISYFTILIILLLVFTSYFLLAVKWSVYLKQYRIIDLFKINMIGTYYSTVLPGQLTGELAKVLKLGKGKSDAEQIAASVLVDKITGMISLLIVGITGALLSSREFSISLSLTFFAVLVLAVSFLICLRIKVFYSFLISLSDKLTNKFPRLNSFVTRVIRMMEEWKLYSGKIRLLTLNTLIGLVTHSIAVLINFLLAQDFGMNIPYWDWCWIYAITSIVLLVPITIAGIGLRDGSLITLIALLGFGREQAMAMSFSALAFVILFAIIGFVFDVFTSNIKPKGENI